MKKGKEKNFTVEPEYELELWCCKLKEIYEDAKSESKDSIELPTRLVGYISSWMIRLCNLDEMYINCLEAEKKYRNLFQQAQDLYNSDEKRPDSKDSEIRKLLGIHKQRSLDTKGLPFDNAQLFNEYARTVIAWSNAIVDGKKLNKEKLNEKKEQIIKSMSERYNITSREAFIGRLKKGKKQLIDKGEDNLQFKGVLPKDWPTL